MAKPQTVLFKHDSQDNINESKKASSNSDLKNKMDLKDEDSSFFDVLSRIQSNRLDDQRCSIRNSSTNKLNSENLSDDFTPNDEFFNLIMKSQRTRLEDQRTTMNKAKTSVLSENNHKTTNNIKTDLKSTNSNTLTAPTQIVRKSVTVPPDDDFFSMIQKIQSRRLDEQRSSIKMNPFASMKTSKSGSEVRKKLI